MPGAAARCGRGRCRPGPRRCGTGCDGCADQSAPPSPRDGAPPGASPLRVRSPGPRRTGRARPRCTDQPGCPHSPGDPSPRPPGVCRAARRRVRPGTAGAIWGLGTVASHPHIQVQVQPSSRPPLTAAAPTTASRCATLGTARSIPAASAELKSAPTGLSQLSTGARNPAQRKARPSAMLVTPSQVAPFASVVRALPRRRARTVRLHHRHYLSAGAGGEEPGADRDCGQLNAEHRPLRTAAAGGGGCRDGAHGRIRSAAAGPYSAAGAPVISAQYRSP